MASQENLDAKGEPTRERSATLSREHVLNGPHGARLLLALSLAEMASELGCGTAETETLVMRDVSASPKTLSSARRAANVHSGLSGALSLPAQLHAVRVSEQEVESVFMAARAKSGAKALLLT